MKYIVKANPLKNMAKNTHKAFSASTVLFACISHDCGLHKIYEAIPQKTLVLSVAMAV